MEPAKPNKSDKSANPLLIVCLCEGQNLRAMRKAFSDRVLFHNYTSENSTQNSF